MHGIISLLALSSAALAASADPASDASSIPASSQVQLAPSSFVYSNSTGKLPAPGVVVPASTGSSTKKQRLTIYDTATATDDSETDITTTICSGGSCFVTTQAYSQTTYTTTVDGVLTVLTSGVPVSSGSPQKNAAKATSAVPSSASSAAPAASSSAAAGSSGVPSPAVAAPSNDVTSSASAPYPTAAPSSVVTGYITEDLTAIEIGTTVVTITSCSDNKCATSEVTTGLTTVTDDHTSYVTYCPLSSVAPKSSATPVKPAPAASSAETSPAESSTVTPSTSEVVETSTEVHKTVITVTSCSDNKCTEVPKTTGLTTVTENDTIYTTYCPFSEESKVPEPSSVAPTTTETTTAPTTIPTTTEATTAPTTTPSTTTTPAKKTSTQEDTISTVDVITNNIVTEAPASTLVHHTTASAPSPVPVISSYNGASTLTTGIFALAASLLFMLI